MRQVPHDLAEQAWKIAGSVEWTVADWTVVYEALTMAFVRIAAMHAKAKIEAAKTPAEE